MSFLNTETQIRVACRVRPLNQMEISQGGQIAVTSNDKTIKIKVLSKESIKIF